MTAITPTSPSSMTYEEQLDRYRQHDRFVLTVPITMMWLAIDMVAVQACLVALSTHWNWPPVWLACLLVVAAQYAGIGWLQSLWRRLHALAHAHHDGSLWAAWVSAWTGRHPRTQFSAVTQTTPASPVQPGLWAFLLNGLRGRGWQLPSPGAAREGAISMPMPSAPQDIAEEDRARTIATRLRAARELAGKSQEHVALEAALSVRTVRRAETEGRASGETLRALCSVLGLDLLSPGGARAALPDDAPPWMFLVRLCQSQDWTALAPLVLILASLAVLGVLVLVPASTDASFWYDYPSALTGLPIGLWAMVEAQVGCTMTALPFSAVLSCVLKSVAPKIWREPIFMLGLTAYAVASMMVTFLVVTVVNQNMDAHVHATAARMREQAVSSGLKPRGGPALQPHSQAPHT